MKNKRKIYGDFREKQESPEVCKWHDIIDQKIKKLWSETFDDAIANNKSPIYARMIADEAVENFLRI